MKQVQQMKNFFQKIAAFFLTFRAKLHTIAFRSVHIVETIKGILNNPAVDFITALTPFGDEVFIKIAREAIGYTSALLNIEVNGTDEEMIQKLGEILKDKGEEFSKVFYRELALQIARSMEDGKISTSELLVIISVIYNGIKNK